MDVSFEDVMVIVNRHARERDTAVINLKNELLAAFGPDDPKPEEGNTAGISADTTLTEEEVESDEDNAADSAERVEGAAGT